VLLVSGDIHVSRLLKYPAESTVGYPLYQLISSPVHARVIPALNVPHPALVHSAVAPNTFLLLTVDAAADEPYVLAQFLDKSNKSIFPDTKIALSSLRQG
jgi:alkaline phosphatase D